MSLMRLAELAEDINIANRERQGLESLTGFLLAWIRQQPGHSDAALMQAMNQEVAALIEAAAASPGWQTQCRDELRPYERLALVLHSHLGWPVHPDDLPQAWQRAFPPPRSLARLHSATEPGRSSGTSE